MSDAMIEKGDLFTDDEIAALEGQVSRKLPKEYAHFLKSYGGAFVGGLVDGSDELPILCFFRPRGEGNIFTRLSLHPDLREMCALPIADCELGNLYVLDRDDEVHYLNYYDGPVKSRKVSNSFESFIQRIRIVED